MSLGSSLNPFVNRFYDWAEIKINKWLKREYVEKFEDLPHLKLPNYLTQFVHIEDGFMVSLTPFQIMQIWQFYSKDAYIEGEMLDRFIIDYCECINMQERKPIEAGGDLWRTLRNGFMEVYDVNMDNKISLIELIISIPIRTHFTSLIQHPKCYPTSVEFMKAWRLADKNEDGFIDEDELADFVLVLIKMKGINQVDKSELYQTMKVLMYIFDANCDHRLHLSEFKAMIEIFDKIDEGIIVDHKVKLTKSMANSTFKIYDRDKNGVIDEAELEGLLCDYIEIRQKDFNYNDVTDLKQKILLRFNAYSSNSIKLKKKEFNDLLLLLKQRVV